MEALKEAVFDIQLYQSSERRVAWKKCLMVIDTVIDTFKRDFKRRKEKEGKGKQAEADKSGWE